MPLSPSIPRQAIHTRTITLEGFRREDGLWDIEGILVDIKAYSFAGRYRPHIPAGEPIHQISVRVTVNDDLVIQAAEAATDYAPFPMCGDITPSVSTPLVGLSLGAGFMREVRARFGGVQGCTHITELLGAVATTAFQTIYPLLREERPEEGRPALIDSCHALAADGEVVAQEWPAFSTNHSSKAD